MKKKMNRKKERKEENDLSKNLNYFSQQQVDDPCFEKK